jgi:hypothetical protein
MGKQYTAINDEIRAFIQRQKIYFTGSAAANGRVNVSPKGLDSLRILGPNRVAWLNLTGSGNETAAHLLENDRLTLMFCAFEGDPLIVRLYGHARAVHPRDAGWGELLALFPPLPGARQIMLMDIDLVQSSCGAGVPLFDYTGERDALLHWVEKKGADGVRDYWDKKNRISLDGKPTGIIEP